MARTFDTNLDVKCPAQRVFRTGMGALEMPFVRGCQQLSAAGAVSTGQLASRRTARELVYFGAPLIAISVRKHGVHDHDMIHAFNHPILVDDLGVARAAVELCERVLEAYAERGMRCRRLPDRNAFTVSGTSNHGGTIRCSSTGVSTIPGTPALCSVMTIHSGIGSPLGRLRAASRSCRDRLNHQRSRLVSISRSCMCTRPWIRGLV